MNRQKPKCWLIGNRAGQSPIAASEIARLRGLDLESCTFDDGLPALIGAERQLIALSFDTLNELAAEQKLRLRRLVENGAAVYLRGALAHGRNVSLAPLADVQFECVIKAAAGYRLASHWILPVALAKEEACLRMNLPIATGLPANASPLILGMLHGGDEMPTAFAIEIGAGVVICDLNADRETVGQSLISQLSDPENRLAAITALAAVDHAAGRDLSLSAPINLVIDDRPINHDFLNIGRTGEFLRRLDSLCPGIHTDFAWTPNQTRVYRRYVSILRGHNTGFVWHGFLRHLDHRSIMDLETDLTLGRKFVREIALKYEVRIQPVMIFPYEKDSPACDSLLRRSGFVAKVESFDPDPQVVPSAYFRLRSGASNDSDSAPFSVLLRDEESRLSRNRMLALAALGLPIIALAHPNDLGVQRFRPTREAMGPTYFDRVLGFAKEKSLRPMSLENVALEMPAD